MNYNYFDGIKVGDKVWGFGIGWSVVQDIITISDKFEDIKLLQISTDIGNMFFNFDGIECDRKGNLKNIFQSLFWDEIKLEIPRGYRIKLKEDEFLICLDNNSVSSDEEFKDARIGDFSIENGLFRDDKETAERALEQIRKFTKLLALRDQECPNSRGYKFNYSYPNFIIYKNYSYSDPKYEVGSMDTYTEEPTVYFKTKEDAQKICDLLNSGRFSLEDDKMTAKNIKKITFNNFVFYLSRKFKVNFRKNNLDLDNEGAKRFLIIFTSVHDFYSLLKNNRIKFGGKFLDNINSQGIVNNMQKYLNKKIPVGIILEKPIYTDYYIFTEWCHINWYLDKSVTISGRCKIIIISDQNQ